MCCYTGNVKVNRTRIFARAAAKGSQYVVYEMSLLAETDGAMILPLPVPPRSAEDAIRFINLEKYPSFFRDLERTFHQGYASGTTYGIVGGGPKPLPVVEVGSFVASFVPTVADFDRLDPQFRLPKETWDAVPYRDYGFAVFKLKAGNLKVHPMAFEFPRKDRSKLFFPTVHVHDGKMHTKADFNHVLYLQLGDSEASLFEWSESVKLAGANVKMDLVKGIVAENEHVYQRSLHGDLPNQDTWV